MLVSQYLQNKKVAKEFAIYYDLFKKYRSDYQIATILEGQASDEIKSRARAAKFDERLALLGLLIDGVTEELRGVCLREDLMTELLGVLKTVRAKLTVPNASVRNVLIQQTEEIKKKLE